MNTKPITILFCSIFILVPTIDTRTVADRSVISASHRVPATSTSSVDQGPLNVRSELQIDVSVNEYRGSLNLGSNSSGILNTIPKMWEMNSQVQLTKAYFSIFVVVGVPEASMTPIDHASHEMKGEPQPIFCPYAAHIQELSRLLDRPCEDPGQDNEIAENENLSDDPDACIMEGDIVPRPLPSTTQGLIKCENDLISASMPFITTVSIKNLHQLIKPFT